METKGVLMNSSEVAALRNYKSDDPKIQNATEARVTMYSAEIAKYFNPDNSFLKFSKQDSRFAGKGKTMKLPQSAGNPTVTKGKFNAETLANGDHSATGTVTVRRNTNKTYTIEYFGTDPQVINFPEETELSYNSRQDMLEAHANAIQNEIADYAIIEWALDDNTEGYIIDSTGTQRLSEVDSATNVLGIAKKDINNAVAILKSQKLPKGSKLYALPTPQQYNDLVKELDIDYLKGGFTKMVEDGIVGKIGGVFILDPRISDAGNYNVLYDTQTGGAGTYTKIALGGAVDGTTDANAMPIWSDKLMYRAEGSPKVYSWMNSPIYKGDVYASEVRFGATRGRSDNKGIVMIVEKIQPGGAE